MISKIGQIAIVVSDVSVALGFYRDLLGLTFLFRASPNLAFLDVDATQLMLTRPEGAGEVGKNSILYFKVTNIESTHSEFVSRGATSRRLPQLTAQMPDHELWIGSLQDPDGNLVCLMEEKR